MSNIIDFNRHKQRRNGASPENDFSLDALMERLENLPDNELMNSISEYVNGRMMKQLVLTDLGRQVTEMLKSIGMNPDDFTLDEESADRFLSYGDITDDTVPFNGPYFDRYDDDAMVRVVTAFQEDEDEESVNLLIAVLKLPDGARRWLRFDGQDWIDDGPPSDYFDDLTGDWDGEDWIDDEDDDEDEFQQEPWEDEYDASIYSLYISPQAIRSLSRAGIETIEQLSKLTDLELLAIEGIDGKELEIIHDALDDEDLDDEDLDAGE